MKREEAIKWVNDRMCWGRGTFTANHLPNIDECWEAGRMAIEALSKPNYETDTEVRLAVTNRKKEKVILWDAFGEVEYYPHGDMYCPNCGVRLVQEDEYLEPTQTHGRPIDSDTLSKKLCGTTIFIKDGELFQRMINDAPTVQADRPHGEWIDVNGDGSLWRCNKCKDTACCDGNFCPNCGADMRKEKE